VIANAASTRAAGASTLRAVVIGCGWIGSEVADDPRADGIQAHAAAYASCADTELVGVCDADPARAERAARRWGLPRGEQDIGELMAGARPQIVSVCTPDATHARVLREVLDCPDVRAVVAEKPLALDLAEARAIVDLASRRGVTLAVNYTRRFIPGHIDAQRRIAAGALGRVVAVQGLYTKGIIHNGSHWFDLARWLVGEITRVQARRTTLTDPESEDPTCHACMTFAGGQTGVLLGLDERCYTAFEMDVIGTEGRLRIADAGMRLEWFRVASSPHFSGYRTLQSTGDAVTGFRDAALRVVEDVVVALRTGARPQCNGEDGVAALAAAQAVRRSLALGKECAVE
jgi:predicted dehydrogenase